MGVNVVKVEKIISAMDLRLVINCINNRFVVDSFDKEKIIEFSAAKICQKDEDLSEKEVALKLLILGSAKVKSRIEEFRYQFLRVENVKLHFCELAVKLSRVAAKHIDVSINSELEEVLDVINNLREIVRKEFLEYHLFDGKGPFVEEKYIYYIKKYPELDLFLHKGLVKSKKVGNTYRIDWYDYFAKIGEKLECVISKTDVLIYTVPQCFDFQKKDAYDFISVPLFNNSKLPYEVLENLKERMVQHKIIEREEVKKDGYIKPYKNNSLYVNARSQGQEHKNISFYSAARKIIDITYDRDVIYGMADIRLIRLVDKPEVNIDDLSLLINLSQTFLYQLARTTKANILYR